MFPEDIFAGVVGNRVGFIGDELGGISKETRLPSLVPTLDTIMSRYVAGTKMEHGEVVYVLAPVPEAPHGTCVWCGEPFEDGDMRCIAMLTEVEDGSWDWLSGEYIHGECDYERDDKTKEEMKND